MKKKVTMVAVTEFCLAGAALLLFALQTTLAINKHFHYDEMYFMNLAWSISEGYVPIKDFYCLFPFLNQILSIACLLDIPDPIKVMAMNLFFQIFAVVVFVLMVKLSAEAGDALKYLSVIFAFSTYAFVATIGQIRPDTPAIALYLAAIYVLRLGNIDARMRGFLSGVLFGLAGWASIKALVYGLPFAVMLVLDFVRFRKKESTMVLGNPFFWIGGLLLVAMSVAMYWTAHGVFLLWIEKMRWGLTLHQTNPHAIGRLERITSTTTYIWRDYAGLLIFSFVGAVKLVHDNFRNGVLYRNLNFLLISSLIFSVVSFVIQRNPYRNSLLPIFVFLSIFAALGFSAVVSLIMNLSISIHYRRVWLGLMCFLTCIHVSLGARHIYVGVKTSKGNVDQLNVLFDINGVTSKTDVVLNVTGAQVIRPNAYYYPYLYTSLFKYVSDEMSEALPVILEQSKCMAWVRILPGRDTPLQPLKLKQYLISNYVPYSRHLWLRGKMFHSRNDRPILRGTFNAIQKSQYFVHPRRAINRGHLQIDGRIIKAQVFSLDEGVHKIEYIGNLPSFYILWLPRNRRMYRPIPPGPARRVPN